MVISLSRHLFILGIAFVAVLKAAPPSFPGAEGFGAIATGGRGGKVIYVTNLNAKGFGSLDSALSVPGPAYILFKVSGVINSIARIRRGHKTIAGQTSPGGVITRGLQFSSNPSESASLDSLYRDNVIVRHMRSRGADDALRVIHTRDVIVDHCSFAFADDECAQISYVTNLTVQNCVFSETNGSHYNYGGMLVNYSNEKYPLDSLSVHHNLFMRLHSRLPDCNCNDNVDSVWCQGRNFKFEFSNNLYWDPGYPIVYSNKSNYNTKVRFSYNLNSVNNYFKVRPGFIHSMFQGPFLLAEAETKTYLSGNRMSIYPNYSDYFLFFCCNNFRTNIGKDHYVNQPAIRLESRHPYPPITYTSTDSLRQYMIAGAGRFPRDSMERRYERYLRNDEIDSAALSNSDQVFGDAFLLDWELAGKPTPAPPPDTDGDGMPDPWEAWNGLSNTKQNHNGYELSASYYPEYGVAAYTNLEVYLNMLSDSLVRGTRIVRGDSLGFDYRIGVGIEGGETPARLKSHAEKAGLYTIKGEKIRGESQRLPNGVVLEQRRGEGQRIVPKAKP